MHKLRNLKHPQLQSPPNTIKSFSAVIPTQSNEMAIKVPGAMRIDQEVRIPASGANIPNIIPNVTTVNTQVIAKLSHTQLSAFDKNCLYG